MISAARAADCGYRALMAGRRVEVPGIGSRLVVLLSTFFPRALVVKVTRLLHTFPDSRPRSVPPQAPKAL